MPRPRPPYLQREVDRHGNIKWYVRIRPNPRIRIHGEYGSPEFMEAYHTAVNGEKKQPKTAANRTLKWLIEQYRKSAAWAELSLSTRRQRENIFKQSIETAGDIPCSAVTRKVIAASRDARAHTPGQAGVFLRAMRGLFKWAVDAGFMEVSPAENVRAPLGKNREGISAWTEEDVARYESRWPRGTKERVWLDVLIYTGLRRGDAVRLGKQHVRDGVISIKTEKSKFSIEVTIPVLPELQKTLDAGPTGDLAFLCGKRGMPLAKAAFGNLFRRACREAGLNKSAHVPVQLSPSLKQYLAGEEERWHLFIREQPTEDAWRQKALSNFKNRTREEHLCPHPIPPCPHLKNNSMKTIFYNHKKQEWLPGPDSNQRPTG